MARLDDSAMGDTDLAAPTTVAAREPGASVAPVEVTIIADRYVDRGAIAAGAMGEIRRVWDRRMRCTMAMKVLAWELVSHQNARARFLEEAHTMAALQHPGIISAADIGQLADGRLWFTMREVQGRTLASVIYELHRHAAGGRFLRTPSGWTLRRLLEAYRHVCESVAYAHGRQIIHRDLKPSNVMLGELGEVFVMDWGIAKSLEAPPEPAAPESTVPPSASDTVHGQVLGTPAYMPLEQARGEIAEQGPWSDVYSLGAILRNILVGKPPYQGGNRLVLARVLGGPPVPIAEAVRKGRPQVPEGLAAICERAMAREPKERHQNAHELLGDVVAWLEGERRRRRARAIATRADETQKRLEQLQLQIDDKRRHADTVLRHLPSHSPADQKRPGWRLQDEAGELARNASLLEVEWLQMLRSALHADPTAPEVHERLADYYYQQLLRAEREGDESAAQAAEALLRTHDSGRYDRVLAANGALTIVTDPPGAEVSAQRYVLRDRRLVLGRAEALGTTPLVRRTLPRGSYLVTLSARGREPVRYPVLIERDAVWDGAPPGESEPQPIWLPPPGAIPAGLVYVPAGWFTSGGDPMAGESLPRRRVWVDGFAIGQHPVTTSDYLSFLDSLVRRGREDAALEAAPRAPVGRGDERVSAPMLERGRDGSFHLRPDVDGVLWQPDWPIVLIDWFGACAYVEWEARRLGVSMRLPGEMEWEKAARGVDGRGCAWGDFIEPTWAGIAGSSDGPLNRTSIHTFPSDVSPYGVRGTVGNVRDWCLDVWRAQGPTVIRERVVPEVPSADEPNDRVARGGSWHTVPSLARAAARFAAAPWRRFGVLGFRVALPLAR
jgi:eukaryotic-like serine/threonine-protein kinase